MKKSIAILAGDGIGPEVMQHALRVLDHVAEMFAHEFTYQQALIGGAAYDEHGEHCPEKTLITCRQADALLFGSVGGPVSEQHQTKWQNCEAHSILQLRKTFIFNVNIRPVILYKNLSELSPLADSIIGDGADILIYRELCGDIYFGKHEFIQTAAGRAAIDEACYDEQQIKAIAHAAFQAAGARRRKVTSVDKANVLHTSKLWREIVNEVSKDYPEIQLEHILVDNCAMQLVLNPRQFDVLLTPNMFGDILSDLAAALVGSLGLLPSASINSETGFAMYEPSGGSAPDLAGKDIANPAAQMLSMALMLRHSFGLEREASLIEKAIQAAINAELRTQDIAGNSPAVSTTEFTDGVVKQLSALAS